MVVQVVITARLNPMSIFVETHNIKPLPNLQHTCIYELYKLGQYK